MFHKNESQYNEVNVLVPGITQINTAADNLFLMFPGLTLNEDVYLIHFWFNDDKAHWLFIKRGRFEAVMAAFGKYNVVDLYKH